MSGPAQASGAPATDGPPAAVAAALDRLAAVLAEETHALEAGDRDGLEAVIRKKSRSLLELTRLARALPREASPADGLRERIADVSDRLGRNAGLLELHLRAARDVADLLADGVARQEWDGTYPGPARPGGSASR